MRKAFKASDVQLQTRQHSGSAGRGERGGTLERDKDGGGRLRERSEEDASCLLNSVACLHSGAAVLHVCLSSFIVPYLVTDPSVERHRRNMLTCCS